MVRPRVIKVTTTSGREIGVKRAFGTARIRREVAILRFLEKTGVVPSVLAVDQQADPDWFVMDWLGDTTLAEAGNDALADHSLGEALVDAVAAVEMALAPVASDDVPVTAMEMLHGLLAPWVRVLSSALEWIVEHDVSTMTTTLANVGATASSSSITVGSLDYHSANVIVRSRGGKRTPSVGIVDLSAVGYDWPGRRVAQYGLLPSSVGRGFASVLTFSVIERWAAFGICTAEAVDAHDILLILSAAARCAGFAPVEPVAGPPTGVPDDAFRRASLRRLLARPLSRHAACNAVRTLARDVVEDD